MHVDPYQRQRQCILSHQACPDILAPEQQSTIEQVCCLECTPSIASLEYYSKQHQPVENLKTLDTASIHKQREKFIYSKESGMFL